MALQECGHAKWIKNEPDSDLKCLRCSNSIKSLNALYCDQCAWYLYGGMGKAPEEVAIPERPETKTGVCSRCGKENRLLLNDGICAYKARCDYDFKT